MAMIAVGLAPLIDAVRPTMERCGYRLARRDCFVFNFSANSSGVVRLSVVGMMKRDVSVALGVRFRSIELKKAAYEKVANYQPSGLYRYSPSIFQDMISSIQDWFPGSISGYAKINDEPVERLCDAFVDWGLPFIQRLSDLPVAAEYGFSHRNLALGAHAYRVPLMLLEVGRGADAVSYMRDIASLDAPIGNYAEFVAYMHEVYGIG